MARSALYFCLLLTAIYVIDGQSTSPDRRCVYTFNVQGNDCDQTPGPSDDVKLLKSSVIALQEQVRQLATENRKLASDNRKLASDVGNLKKERPNNDIGTVNQESSTGGAVYIRWGRTSCPDNGTDLLYSGIAGGAYYTHTGGGSNYLCLPRDPEWGPILTSGFQSGGYLHGAEYQTLPNDPFSKANARSLINNDVPCAVCLVTSRPTKLMIPAKLTCPPGWSKEYSGYLMAQYYRQTRTTYVCVDNAPEVIQGGAPDKNGVLFYNIEAKCGSLPCPNYIEGWEITCIVCTK